MHRFSAKKHANIIKMEIWANMINESTVVNNTMEDEGDSLCQVKRQANHHVFSKNMDGSIKAVELIASSKKKGFFTSFPHFSRRVDASMSIEMNEQLRATPAKSLRSSLAGRAAPFTTAINSVYSAFSILSCMKLQISVTSVASGPNSFDMDDSVICPGVIPDAMAEAILKLYLQPAVRIQSPHEEFDAGQRERYQKGDEATFDAYVDAGLTF